MNVRSRLAVGALLVVALGYGCRSDSAGPNPVASVTVNSGTGDLRAGTTRLLSATLRNPSGSVLTGRTVTWRSANPQIASVSLDGLVTALTTGITQITATSERVEGSAQIVVVPGPAVALAFTVPAATTVVGEVILPAVQVTARDALGNVATDFVGSVTVALATNPAGGTLTGPTTVAAVAGVATFAGLSLNKIGSGYALQAAADGLTGATTPSFAITHGPVAALAFTVMPRDTIAGAVFAPAVQITLRDALGNVATGFSGTVAVALGTNAGGGVLSGTTTVGAVNGVATFPTLSVNRVGVGYTLTASAAGLPDVTSSPFAIRAGSPSQLAFTVQPGADTAGAMLTPAVQVTAQDAQGNTAMGFTGPITVAIGTNPGGATLSGTTTISAVNGVASFATLRLNRTGTGYTLTATAAGLTGATSGAFTVNPGTATVLVFTVQPGPATAGAPITPAVQVTARDAQGNIATGFAGPITVALGGGPGSAVGGTATVTLAGTTTVSAVNGVATFATLSVTASGNGYALTAAATGLASATSATFAVTPGAAVQLAFTVQPANDTVSAVLTPAVQVTARDALGNTATDFNGNVTVALGTNPANATLSGATIASAVAGVATFTTLSVNRSGAGYTLTASAAGLSGATSASFTVAPGVATQLVFTIQPGGVAAGVVLSPAVQVTALDARGSVATGFAGPITIGLGANPGGATLSGTMTLNPVSGVASFATLSLNRPGVGYTLTAAATGPSGATSAPFTVTSGAAVQLAFTVQPRTDTAGAVLAPTVRVTAFDAEGNVATSFGRSVSVLIGSNPGGATLSGTTSVSAVAGVASFGTLRLNRTGVGYTLVAVATGVTDATSTPFTVTPGTASQLVFTVQPGSDTAGALLTPAVQVSARDPQGNAATGFNGNITVALGTNPGGSTLSGNATVTAVNGVASFATLSLNRTGAGYTLTAAGAGMTGATSAAFSVTPATARQLAFTVQPATTSAGAVLTPAVQVTARDAYGNNATGFGGPIALAIGTNPGGAVLSGTTTVSAVAGVASFTILSVDKVGTGYTLTAGGFGLTGATSLPFSINPGAATQLAFTVEPGDGTAGAALAPAVQVTARDAQGNTVTSFGRSVTVVIGSNPGGSTLSGSTTVNAVAGIATFGTLRLNRPGAGYTLLAIATGVSDAISDPFTITPGAATQLVFTAEPASAAAGAPLTPAVQITARDAQGNTATGFGSDVSVALGTNPGGGTLSGTTTVTAVNGVASFASLSVDKTGAGYTLTAAGPGVAGATSAGFNITPATATQLAFTVQPGTTTAGALVTPSVRVSARDAHGNLATGFTGLINVAIGINPGGGALSGSTTVSAVAGVAIFTSLSVDKTGAGYTLTAAAGGLAGATSAAFSITPSFATQLAFTVQPSSDTAGAVLTPAVQVTARDALGNTATGYVGSVTVTFGTNPGGATLSGTTTVSAVAGVASFATLRVNRTGVGYTLTAAATGLSGSTSAAFTITQGTPSQLTFTVQPATTTAGAIAPAVQVTARDGQGNPATGFNGPISIALGTNPGGGTLSGTTTVSALNGVANFATLSVDKAGAGYTLTAAATGLASATSGAFTVTPGVATQLTFLAQPAPGAAGAALAPAVQVSARDAYGNIATAFTGLITVAIGTNPGSSTLSGATTVSALNGVATFATLSLNRPGVGYTLTAAAASLAGATSAAFTVDAGAATQLAFTVQPAGDTAGGVLTPAVQITARDAQGNTATGFSGSVTVAIGNNPGGATLSGTTTVAAVNGVASFTTLSLNRAGVGYTLTGVASGLGGSTSAAFTITPGSASQLVFTVHPPTDTAGAVLSPAIEVTARDAHGNTVTGYSGPVTVALGANPSGGTLSGTTTVNAVAGVARFTTLRINRAGAGYTKTATAPGLSGSTSAAFTVIPGTATELAFTVQPATDTAGAVLTPAVQVTARDAQGNTATGFTGLISVAIGSNPGSSTLSGATTVSALNGVATFATLSLNRTGVGYTLTAASSGLSGATSAPFTVTLGTASQLVFTVQPVTDTAGAVLTPAVQVTARDPQGNTVTEFTGDVSVAIGANPGGAALSGSTTASAVNGVASFATLRLNRTGVGYTLTASAAGLGGATSAAFTITPGTATQLAFAGQPGTSTAGAAISPTVQVAARDAHGNTATGFSGPISLALGTNPAGGTLSGITTVSAVNGVATYATPSVDKAGVGYTLTAAATGLTGTTSAAFTVTPSAATDLVFTVQPGTTTAGATMAPTVQVTARDAHGNDATGFTGLVSIVIETNPGGGALSGATTVSAVAGVASFAALSIDRTGTGYTLAVVAAGLNGATSAAFSVTPGAATQLAFTVQPGTTTAGAAIAPAVQVTARDAQGNDAPAFTGFVSIANESNPGGGALSGATTVSAVDGVASFATLSIDRSGTGYTLTATATGLAGTTSAAFAITPGPAAQLLFTVEPGASIAGAAITPTVQVSARDVHGNTATGFSGPVSLALGTNPGGATLSGTTTVSAVAGVASFTTPSVDKVGVGYTLTAAAAGLTGATSAAFSVTPGAATQLAFTVQPGTTTAGAAVAPAVQVTARDAQGNDAPAFTGLVSIAIESNPGGGALSGATTVSAVDGVASFATLSIDRSGTGYTLTATATGLAGTTSAAFAITPGPAAQLLFTVEPGAGIAGAAITPTVQVSARDVHGNTATGFSGPVSLALGTNPGGATLSGTTTVSAVAGVASFTTPSVDKVGVGYTLTAAAAGLTGATSAAFSVTPGAATQLAFTVQPGTTTAGAAIAPAVQVTARDAQGNDASGFTGLITLDIGTNPGGGTLSGTTTVSAVAGVASFTTPSVDKVGVGYTLTAAAAGLTGATSAAFSVTPGAATQLAFTVQPGTTTAGATIAPAVQVTARDAQGNDAPAFTGLVSIAIESNPGGGALSGATTVSAVGGVASFATLSIDRSGTGYTLTAVAAGLGNVTSAAFTVAGGTATQLAFTVQPTSDTAGALLTPAVQVTARDALGNTATGFTGPISLTIGTNPGGATLSGTATVDAVNGVASFTTLSLNRTGAGYSLIAAATGLSGALSAPFNVTPGSAAQLAFTVQPATDTAGAVLAPAVQVTARDAHGNVATGFTGLIGVAIGTNPGGGTLSGTAAVNAVAGVASFTTLSLNRTGAGYTLVATANGLTNGISAAFSITAGTATHLAFTDQPGLATAGAVITPAVRVTARDALGNAATGFTGAITVAIGTNAGVPPGILTGTTTMDAVAGVATFATLSLDRTGIGYTLTAAATGLGGSTSAPFTVTTGVPTQLAFTVQPVTDTAGAVLTPAVQVTALDALGNIATTFTGVITVAIGTNPGGGTLSGTTAVSAVAGVASFTTLRLNRTGVGYTLTAAATGLSGATSAAFTINPGTVTRLAFTVEPVNTTAAVVIAPAVQVAAQDAQGNTVPAFTGLISVAIGANPGSGTLSGTTAVSAVGGVASFATLSMNRAGVGYTLTAAATGLSGATSAPFTINPGVATQLVFTVQPGTTAAGSALTPAVQVTARDAQGNTATGFSGLIGVAIGTNPNGGTLGGTASLSAVAGVASFATLTIDRVGVGYTLTAAASGLSGATSAPFTINPGVATQLAFIVQPGTDTAGALLAPALQVAARDAQGNPVTSFTGLVSVAIGINPGGGTLSGATTVSAVAGVASFATLSINRTGAGYTLTALATGLSSATSAAFSVNPGTATQLAFTVQPVTDTAAAVLTPAVQIAARDALGNTATGFTGLVSVVIGTNPGSGTLSGTTTVNAVAGVASFSTLSINRSGAGYTLIALSTGLTGALSAPFAVTPGTATQLVFTVQPPTDTAGAVLAPAVRVTARDAQGNTATGFSANVVVAIGTNPGVPPGTLSGTTTVAAVAGVASFSTLSVNRTGVGYTLTAAATGLTGATSTAFTINPGTATQLAFTVQPVTDTAMAVLAAVQVTARDARGNTATGFAGSITVAIGTNPGVPPGILSGTKTMSAVAGVASFATLSLDRTGVGYTLTAAAAGLAGTISTAFSVNPGTATQLAFTVQPATATAGAALTPAVQVTARDAQGNTATGFIGTVTIAIGTNPGVPPGTLGGTATVPAVAGVASFATLSINRTGVGYTLTAAATGLTGATSAVFTINPGAATQLAFTVQPSTTPLATTAAGPFITPPVQVTARDAQGNTATTFTGVVTIAIGTNPSGGSLGGPASTRNVAAVAGVATFSLLRINLAGVGYTLTAAATGLTGATSLPFTIITGGVSAALSTVTAATAIIGQCLVSCETGLDGSRITVVVRDQAGAVVPAVSVTLASSAGTRFGNPGFSGVTDAAGRFSADFTASQAGLKSVSATATSVAITQAAQVSVMPVLVGAGDIADCITVPPANSGAAVTGRQLDSIPGEVFTLGDNVYEDGTAAEFAYCYEPTWGRHRARTRPSAGNHEYQTLDAAGYFGYFGAAAGPSTGPLNERGYYSFDIGSWHVVVLNDNIAMADSVAATDSTPAVPVSPQLQWLRQELNGRQSQCVLAIWHRPLYTSGISGGNPPSQPLWRALADSAADVVLWGHDHNYERFDPMNAAGGASGTGMRAFVVGTGGVHQNPIPYLAPNSAVRENTSLGVLRLVLYQNSYRWQFLSGNTAFTDGGTGTCH